MSTSLFDFYYGDESEQFTFYRIPRQLITGTQFKRLSTDAKLLCGLMLALAGRLLGGRYEVVVATHLNAIIFCKSRKKSKISHGDDSGCHKNGTNHGCGKLFL